MSLLTRRRIAAAWFCLLSLPSVPFAVWGMLAVTKTFGLASAMQIGSGHYPFSYSIVALLSLGLYLMWIVSLLYNLPFALLALLLIFSVHHGPWRTSEAVFVFVIYFFGFSSFVGCVLSALSVDYRFRSNGAQLQ